MLDEVSAFNEDIMEAYLEEGSVPPEKLERAFAGCVAKGEISPVLCGSRHPPVRMFPGIFVPTRQ